LESCLRRKDSGANVVSVQNRHATKSPQLPCTGSDKERGFIKAALDDVQMGGTGRARSEAGRYEVIFAPASAIVVHSSVGDLDGMVEGHLDDLVISVFVEEPEVDAANELVGPRSLVAC